MAHTLKPLAQQTIVITGASSGIGLATAYRAAASGARVVLVARNEEALQQAVGEIRRRGGRAAYCPVDVTEQNYPERVGAVAHEHFGGFDSWVNNAASAIFARLADVSEAEHRQVFDTGYFGTVAGSLFAAKELRRRDGGAIVNVGSILSERALPIQGTYCAMKHAVLGFTDALRMELEEERAGISVTLIKPSAIDTPYPEHARNKMARPAAIPPLHYHPDLVAKAICFACATPRRELLVGGQGYLITRIGTMFPRVTDKVMELAFTESGQSTDIAPEPGTTDNLFEERRDGRVRSNQHPFTRRTSLALEAQLHPLAAIALGVGVAALATLLADRRTS